MSQNRAGGYVPSGEVDASGDRDEGKRKAVWSFVSQNLVMVANRMISDSQDQALGFQFDSGLNSSRAFARELGGLCEEVAYRQPADSSDPKALRESLSLTRVSSLSKLKELRSIGAGLRSELSGQVVEALTHNGWRALTEDVPDFTEQPILTFQSLDAPILWEMMYEGSQLGEPDWKRFWGFSVPTTHWVNQSRAPRIDLQYGCFSAIDETLEFAEQEARLLNEQLRPDIPKGSLAENLRGRVEKELRGHLDADDKVDAWLRECPKGTWLAHYLDEWVATGGDEDTKSYDADQWKEGALADVLKQSHKYDLIHFACHCEPEEDTEFLTYLDWTVGGEPMSLEVTLLTTPELRQEVKSLDQRGPLVFLNACGTAQQGKSYEAPGFPRKWIDCSGALAVVATLCPVPDYFAHAFSRQFYHFLLGIEEKKGDGGSGRATPRYPHVADALLATRRYFMEQYNNPLGLAYVLYACPGAYVSD